eukprot:m.305361 g.305361  ORF g.305361 m.305361 type:complete len:645 (+) comp40859_c0_seq6:2504-4438(+)
MGQTASNCPDRRFGHNSAIIGREMLVWGGGDGIGSYLSHEIVWRLDLDEKSWSKRMATFEGKDDLPRPSAYSGIAIVGDREIYQFGGEVCRSSPWKYFNDLHKLDGVKLEWRRILPKEGTIPEERSECGMCVLDDQLVIMGGHCGDFLCKSDVWAFSLRKGLWSEVKSMGKTPSPRIGHSFTAIDKNRAVLIGGWDPYTVFDDSFLFNIDSKEWEEISTSFRLHKLTPRYRHSAICVNALGHGSRLFVFWGRDKDGNFLPNAEIIDLSTMKYTEISFPDVPLSSYQTVCSVLLMNGNLGFIRFGGWYGRGKPSVLMDALQWDPHLEQFSVIDINDLSIAILDKEVSLERFIERSEFEFDDDDFLGSGGYGEVYRGRMKKSGERVAVKMFCKRTRTRDQSELSQKEAKILFGVKSHPNIVKIIGICDSPQHPALLMEFIDGGDLAALLRSSKPEVEKWANRIDISLQVASGMAHLHGNNPTVIHLDLNPRNVLIQNLPPRSSQQRFLCKICDFGLSKMEDVSKVTQERREGSIPGGTVAFIAPERYNAYGSGSLKEKEEVAKKSDVFSYGVLLWAIRERKYPFEGMPEIAIGIQISSGRGLPEGTSQAPDVYNQLVKDCSAFDPKSRPSFTEVMDYLYKIQAQFQ